MHKIGMPLIPRMVYSNEILAAREDLQKKCEPEVSWLYGAGFLRAIRKLQVGFCGPRPAGRGGEDRLARRQEAVSRLHLVHRVRAGERAQNRGGRGGGQRPLLENPRHLARARGDAALPQSSITSPISKNRWKCASASSSRIGDTLITLVRSRFPSNFESR